MKRIIPLLLVAVFFLMSTIDAEAQRKRKRRTAEKEKTEDPFDKTGQLYQEIKTGNFVISNGFNMAAKYSLGYSINKRISLNASPKMWYSFLNAPGSAQNLHLFDWGATAGLRGKITESIYLQAEYGYHNIDGDGYDSVTTSQIREKYGELRIKEWAPLIGGGYLSGQGPWKTGLEVLFQLNDDVRDFSQVVEYWISFSYNF